MKALKGWSCCMGLGALLMAISIVTTAKDLYRWTGTDGTVHYSDQPPPPDAKDFKALNRPHSNAQDAGDSGEASDSYEDQEAAFQRRQAERAEREAKQQQADAAAAERKNNCELARSNYNTISVGGRITRVDANGERVYLTDAEIAKETAAARKTMQEYCDN